MYFGSASVSEDGAELWSVRHESRELEITPLTKANKKDALPVLWNHAAGVDDCVIDGVTKCFREHAVDDVECSAAIVAFQVLNVLQHECGGPVEVEDVGDGEEEVALLQVIEAVLAAEAQLLRNAGNAERLTRKSGAEDVVRGDVGDSDGVNIAVRFSPKFAS